MAKELEPKILALNPGTRYLGVAFFSGPELRDWGVKVFKGKFSQEKLSKILSWILRVVRDYQAEILALKALHPSRASQGLKDLVKSIRELAKREKLKLYQYSIEELKTSFLKGKGEKAKRGNKRELARTIASFYPHLFLELEKERKNKNPYHLKMFEAVALGTLCLRAIEGRKDDH